MSRKFLNAKERLLYYIESKNISKNKFYTLTGVSNGVLDKKSELSISTIEKIYYTFPELSLEWILFEKGEMLRENIEKKSTKCRYFGKNFSGNFGGKQEIK